MVLQMLLASSERNEAVVKLMDLKKKKKKEV